MVDARRVLVVLVALLLVGSSAFAVDASGGRHPDPVPFDDTIRTGLPTASTVQARAGGYAVPRAEVFYSGYRYVVGYYGVESLVAELDRPGHDRQFGRPLAVYVSDFSEGNPELTEEGYLRTVAGLGSDVGWVPAEEAHFVVGSRARVPGTDSVVVPFGERGEAAAFVDEHGGTVRDWAAVRSMDVGPSTATRDRMRAAVDDHHAWADRRVAATRDLLDRPVSVVVGEDAPTLAAAVAAAPANTTVRLPPGTYGGNVTVEKPLTVRGAGPDTHLRGDGNGTVLAVRSPRVAVADLRITGVGNATSPDVAPNETDGESWDYRIQLGYGYGDAGVSLVEANGSLVRNVTVRTPANGVLLRDTAGAVVDGVVVHGSEEWQDGFMGVMVMDSRPVVQRSSFHGGRDGVYTHLADGIVVRDNDMEGMRFGVHEMYTSDALVANNAVRDTDMGIVVMTRPTGNLVVDNDVRRSYTGISLAGDLSYVAGNVVVDNEYGFQMPSQRSLYEKNTVVANEVGLRASSLIPTNRVVANDVVGNDRPVFALLGPLRVWTGERGGNYWGEVPGLDRDGDGAIDRAYRPTDPVDRRVGRVAGAGTLARSPAVASLHALGDVLPGLRGTGVLDTRPLARPVRPDVLADLNATGTRPGAREGVA